MDKKREQSIKERDNLLARKKELWWKQKHQTWLKMFNTINSELFKQLDKDSIDYKLYDTIEEYKENYTKQMMEKIQKEFPFKLNSMATGSLQIEQLKNIHSYVVTDNKELNYFLKDISKLIKDEKLIVVAFDFKTPVLEIDSKVLKKLVSFQKLLQMTTDSEIYITNHTYDWIIEHLYFEDEIKFALK